MSTTGKRCKARGFLEFDHLHPHALGGSGDASNLRLLCRSHNRLAAEQAFGRAHVEEQIYLRQQKSKSRKPMTAATTTPQPHPQSVSPTFEVAERALTRMGFPLREVTPVLNQLKTAPKNRAA